MAGGFALKKVEDNLVISHFNKIQFLIEGSSSSAKKLAKASAYFSAHMQQQLFYLLERVLLLLVVYLAWNF